MDGAWSWEGMFALAFWLLLAYHGKLAKLHMSTAQ